MSMATNIETTMNQVDTPVDLTTRDLASVEENRTLRHVMTQLWQAWANGQEPPTSIPGFLRSQVSDPHRLKSRYQILSSLQEKLIDHGVVVMTDDQNTSNVTNNPLPAQNNLVGMISDDQEYKLLGKMGKSFRKIGEDMSLKSSEPVASLSVECVNLDTKVLCVLEVSEGIEVRAGMLKLYVSKGFSLTQWDQSCLAKLKEPIFVKPVQQLSVTDSKVVPWNYNKIVVVY
ncbi:hypothetical protein H5410_061358 [Solanum commersonii]|uniref:Uncharacterized protein n=1 Tax=Solanum commersonii TaxID=4109 RepID=A0A9J5W8X2_SOLCO|nr:hypothetical protein H5410_061358 [Solanum commersonii]